MYNFGLLFIEIKYIIMKSTLIFTTLVFAFYININAQTEGSIVYSETFKLDLQIEGMDDSMKEMIPQSQTVKRELFFGNNQSVFKTQKGEGVDDVDISSDDGSFEIVIMIDDAVDNILYKNMKEKAIIHQKGIMGKPFLVIDDLKRIKWKITPEKVKYLGYECQKAVLETNDVFVIAWFTSQIPVQVGPSDYHGLPGAILMVNVNDGEVEFKATKVDLRTLDENMLQAPKKGKEITEEEYQSIQKEKESEMTQMHGRRERKEIRN